MLVTDRFVIINLPKTGSTFVREVFKAMGAHRRWWPGRPRVRELLLPNANLVGGVLDQHGKVQQIPPESRHLPIVSVVRNPYDKFLSAFEYRFWARYPQFPEPELRARFPHWPDLSVDDFVRLKVMQADRLAGSNPQGIGVQTLNFARFFSPDPAPVLDAARTGTLDLAMLRASLAPIRLLRQETLRDDLAAFLHEMEYPRWAVDLCYAVPQANVTPRGPIERSRLWTAAAVAHIRQNERLLLALLREWGIDHAPPTLEDEPTMAASQAAA